MEEKKYLNEEDYQRYNAKVKKVGKILLIVGLSLLVISIILIVIGAINFGNTVTLTDETKMAKNMFGGMGLFAIGSFMSVFSFGLASVGAICLLVAHRREITAYTTQQVMPVAKEGIEEMAPTIGKASEKMAPAAGIVAEEVAKGIKKGLKDEE